ncbi:hypothetical protein NDK47_08485 [Brevibacillus ruminantium]|uniref:Anti-sigma factor n=1 Tax=Brevibacillus ruminantium TaxID=2950604 RepID=A0ABY4WJI4_9BACL|nr:hypothetical protein [Brevibacillus ruminantium]USG67295.1 hypothetical protein NDK47_08485 [Brevibacillus ruminantium]
MNCQEFRKAWEDNSELDTFSHIEICDDCMVWIEAQLANGEEVQFLKEIPQPSAELEDKIMQAIYQTAGQGLTPQAVAAPVLAETKVRRFAPKFSGMAWASAAAILLLVGVMGYKQLGGNQLSGTANISGQAEMQIALAPASGESQDRPNETENNAVSGSASQSPDAPVSSPAAMMAMPSSGETVTAMDTPETADSKSSDANPSAKQMAPDSGQRQQPVSQPSQIALAAPKQQEAKTQADAAPAKNRPIIAARHAGGKPPGAEQAKTAAPAENQQSASDHASSIAALAPETEEKALLDNTMGALSMDAEAGEEVHSAAGHPTLVGPPVTATTKPDITLSTFTDVDTAANASDMPVPDTAKLPDGFSLHAITAQYESQTSQKVVRLTSEYKRNHDWIRVEVVRNEHGKRSLSIPGTFTATQLFTVHSEQAIAVTFDKKDDASSETTAQHAVHFNAQHENDSLYVILTAHGIPLDQLVETSKQITWQ